MDYKTIFDYIVSQEANYQTRGVPITDGYEWKMYEHIRLTTLYKNSQLDSGNDGSKPIKNIIRPILNVAYRSEGFDVKDIQPFVDDSINYWKSFLVKKYHPRWARKYGIDEFIDELTETYIDYGGVLVKRVTDLRPEVVQWATIAFCDQTDILAGTIAIKHEFTADQLQDTVSDLNWNQTSVNDAIDQSTNTKDVSLSMLNSNKVSTPQPYIEVYEVHGNLPTDWLLEDDDPNRGDPNVKEFTKQVQYVTFGNSSKKDMKQGIVLWRGKEKKSPFKFKGRNPIFGRALGFGGVEELFEAQVWTTYSMIKIKDMLDAAALMLLQTEDQSFASKNKINDLSNNEIMVHAPGKPVTQVSIQPQNIVAFNNFVQQWSDHAKSTGAANDAIQGISPAAGTPFALQDLVVQQGDDTHKYYQGKISDFLSELYRDWFLPGFSKDLSKGDTWLDDLSLEEMQWIADALADAEVKQRAVDAFKAGGVIYQSQGEQIKELVKQTFLKKGSKQFLQIFEGEMKGLPIDVVMNIAGKQADLAKISDKLSKIFQQIFANPGILMIPGMAKLFNQIIESAGLNPADFSTLTKQQVQDATGNAPTNPAPTPVQSTDVTAKPVATQ